MIKIKSRRTVDNELEWYTEILNLILRRAIYLGLLLPRRSPDPTPDRHGQNGAADIGVDVIQSSTNTESGAVPKTLRSEPRRKKSGFGGKTTRTPEPPIVNFAIDLM